MPEYHVFRVDWGSYRATQDKAAAYKALEGAKSFRLYTFGADTAKEAITMAEASDESYDNDPLGPPI